MAAGKRQDLYHVTRGQNIDRINKEGFHGKSRYDTSGGADYGGSVFGDGTYFHGNKADSDKWLAGAHMFEHGDEKQIRVQGSLRNPLVAHIPGTSREDDAKAFEDHLRKIGVLKPSENYTPNVTGRTAGVNPKELTRRLQAKGYDGIDVRARGKNGEDSQILVFDPKQARVLRESKLIKERGKNGTLVYKKPAPKKVAPEQRMAELLAIQRKRAWTPQETKEWQALRAPKAPNAPQGSGKGKA